MHLCSFAVASRKDESWAHGVAVIFSFFFFSRALPATVVNDCSSRRNDFFCNFDLTWVVDRFLRANLTPLCPNRARSHSSAMSCVSTLADAQHRKKSCSCSPAIRGARKGYRSKIHANYSNTDTHFFWATQPTNRIVKAGQLRKKKKSYARRIELHAPGALL